MALGFSGPGEGKTLVIRLESDISWQGRLLW